MKVYHVVTDRPINVGQKIIFDENNHSGVYERVINKIDVVNEIYRNPKNYKANELEHHTSESDGEFEVYAEAKEKWNILEKQKKFQFIGKLIRTGNQEL